MQMLSKFMNNLFLYFDRRIAYAKEQQRLAHLHSVASLAPGTIIRQEGTIENIFGDPNCISVGHNSYVRGRLLTYAHGGRINIGDYCYVGVRSEIWSMESISIGDRVLIAHDVNIHDGTAHSQNAKERHEHYKKILTMGHPENKDDLPGVHSAPIIIEDDVWISFGVTVLKGVHIGKGSIIAAASIVTKDVPAGMIYKNTILPQITALRYGYSAEKTL